VGYVYYTHISVALHIDSVEEKEEEEEDIYLISSQEPPVSKYIHQRK